MTSKEPSEEWLDITTPYSYWLQAHDYKKIIEKDLERYDQLKLDYLAVEEYARKYKSLISGKLWRDGKERTKWFNKIRSQKDWIDNLSKLREFEITDEEQFLRVVKHLDTQVLYWALLSLEEEIKRYSEEKLKND